MMWFWVPSCVSFILTVWWPSHLLASCYTSWAGSVEQTAQGDAPSLDAFQKTFLEALSPVFIFSIVCQMALLDQSHVVNKERVL